MVAGDQGVPLCVCFCLFISLAPVLARATFPTWLVLCVLKNVFLILRCVIVFLFEINYFVYLLFNIFFILFDYIIFSVSLYWFYFTIVKLSMVSITFGAL